MASYSSLCQRDSFTPDQSFSFCAILLRFSPPYQLDMYETGYGVPALLVYISISLKKWAAFWSFPAALSKKIPASTCFSWILKPIFSQLLLLSAWFFWRTALMVVE